MFFAVSVCVFSFFLFHRCWQVWSTSSTFIQTIVTIVFNFSFGCTFIPLPPPPITHSFSPILFQCWPWCHWCKHSTYNKNHTKVKRRLFLPFFYCCPLFVHLNGFVFGCILYIPMCVSRYFHSLQLNLGGRKTLWKPRIVGKLGVKKTKENRASKSTTKSCIHIPIDQLYNCYVEEKLTKWRERETK